MIETIRKEMDSAERFDKLFMESPTEKEVFETYWY